MQAVVLQQMSIFRRIQRQILYFIIPIVSASAACPGAGPVSTDTGAIEEVHIYPAPKYRQDETTYFVPLRVEYNSVTKSNGLISMVVSMVPRSSLNSFSPEESKEGSYPRLQRTPLTLERAQFDVLEDLFTFPKINNRSKSLCMHSDGVPLWYNNQDLGSIRCDYRKVANENYGGVRLRLIVDSAHEEKKQEIFDHYRWAQVVYTNMPIDKNQEGTVRDEELGKKIAYLDPRSDCSHAYEPGTLQQISGPKSKLKDYICADGGVLKKLTDFDRNKYCLLPFYPNPYGGSGYSSQPRMDIEEVFIDQPIRRWSLLRKNPYVFWKSVVTLYGVKKMNNNDLDLSLIHI